MEHFQTENELIIVKIKPRPMTEINVSLIISWL